MIHGDTREHQASSPTNAQSVRLFGSECSYRGTKFMERHSAGCVPDRNRYSTVCGFRLINEEKIGEVFLTI